MITIADCLKRMHAGEVFSLKVVSYDKRRKDNTGQASYYAEAVLMWGNVPADTPSGAAKGERGRTDLEKSLIGAAAIERKPRHADNYTRNIRLLADGKPTEAIVKIHPPLIIEFNGQVTCP